MSSNLRVIRNADGRLELFYISIDNGIYHRWQTSPKEKDRSPSWSAEARLGTTEMARALEVEMNGDGRLELFYIGTDGNFYHKWQLQAGSNQWSQENKLSHDPAEIISQPNTIYNFKIGRSKTGRMKNIHGGENIDGRLELFYTTQGQVVNHKRQTAVGAQTWSTEVPLPINEVSQVDQLAVGQNRNGRLELFCTQFVSLDGLRFICRRSQVAPDSAQWTTEKIFHPINDTALQLAVGQNNDGRLELFYIGTNGNLYHRWQTKANTDAWTPEVKLGENDSARQIVVGRNQDRRLELFYIGSNNKLYHKWQLAPDGIWSDEAEFDNTGDVAEIAVGSNADECLELVYTSGGSLYHVWQPHINNGWSGVQLL